MRLLDRKKGRITDILFVIAWHVIRLPGRKNGGAVTDSLFVGMEFLVMRLPSKKWQCHWHSVGPNVIRLPGRKQMVVSLTRCLSWDFNWWDYLAKRGQCHTLPVGNVIRPVHDRRRGNFHSQAVALDKMRWVCLAERKGLTHKLLAMGWKVMQPESWQKNSATTHILFAMGYHVIRLWGQNKSSVTHLLLIMGLSDGSAWWERVQGHSLPVGHGMRSVHGWL